MTINFQVPSNIRGVMLMGLPFLYYQQTCKPTVLPQQTRDINLVSHLSTWRVGTSGSGWRRRPPNNYEYTD